MIKHVTHFQKKISKSHGCFVYIFIFILVSRLHIPTPNWCNITNNALEILPSWRFGWNVWVFEKEAVVCYLLNCTESYVFQFTSFVCYLLSDSIYGKNLNTTQESELSKQQIVIKNMKSKTQVMLSLKWSWP